VVNIKDKILNFAKEIYNTDAEYLWKSSPENAVLRHRCNRKWYAVIIKVSKNKIGLKGDGAVWIIDVKTTSDIIEQIGETVGFLPGYHMNKKHWISILLDGSVPLKVVCRFIETSYGLTVA
jgi:predicted DNA-binding protein (MmcQ/YjbR family)